MKNFGTLLLFGAVALASTSAFALHSDGKCTSCHIPHKADSTAAAPLWNPRLDVRTSYIPYTSLTMKATPGQPNGVSKLCLTCHGVEDNLSYHLGGGLKATTGVGDFSDDHPISIVYDSALATTNGFLFDPAVAPSHEGAKSTCTFSSSGRESCVVSDTGRTTTIAADLLKAADIRDAASPKNLLECTSCHDVHNKYNIVANVENNNSTATLPVPGNTTGATMATYTVKKYMKMTPAAGYMCRVCHTYGSNYGQTGSR